MPIDDRTTNRSYKLPNAGNFLADDVQRLRDALTAIDADVFARYTKTETDQKLADLINGAPGALDTLNELAAAMGNDPNFAATITNALAGKPGFADVWTRTQADARYVQGISQTENTFTGTGSQTTFALTQTPPTRESLLVTVDGVVQPVSAYTLSGSALILSEAPASGAFIRVLMLGIAGPVQSASTLNFAQAGTGAATRTVEDKLRDVVSARDFGAVGDGVTNDSAAIQAAINTGKRVVIPSGTYLCNVTIPSKFILEGDGSTATILRPYNTAIAAVTYTGTAPYWTFHSEVRDIGFEGIGTKAGVGFTCGKTNPADFAGIDQYVGNIKFYGCYFKNLDKGAQFPFGNIGAEFYSCGFSSNRYAIYSLNNKHGGDAMHGGCKYFYAGEMSSNDCALYLHDTSGTSSDTGGIVFNNTIFEYNAIAAYVYSAAAFAAPISWNDCWVEGNGGGSGTVTIDAWSSTTKTTQTVTKRSFIFDGSQGEYVFRSSGLADVNVLGSNIRVVGVNCRVESVAGYGGNVFSVSQPTTSTIELTNPSGYSLPQTDGVISVGSIKSLLGNIDNNSTASSVRWFVTAQRSAKLTSYGPSKAVTAPLTTSATTGAGSFSLTGTVVSDGLIYASCNEFSRANFLSTEYTALTGSSITTSAGWYVFTLDMKRTEGSPKFFIWDRNTAQFVIYGSPPSLGKWYTFAAIAYSAGSQTLYLDFSGSNETCTWRISAYQLHRFGTYQQAANFLASGAFAES